MAIPETLGERIQAALDDAGLTQIKAAELLGLNRQTIGRWVAGEEVPEAQLLRVEEITGRSRAWLRYGLVDAAESEAEHYRAGYEDGLKAIREMLSRLQPPLKRSPDA